MSCKEHNTYILCVLWKIANKKPILKQGQPIEPNRKQIFRKDERGPSITFPKCSHSFVYGWMGKLNISVLFWFSYLFVQIIFLRMIYTHTLYAIITVSADPIIFFMNINARNDNCACIYPIEYLWNKEVFNSACKFEGAYKQTLWKHVCHPLLLTFI